MRFITKVLFVLFLFVFTNLKAQTKTDVYLIPGQGADERLFKNLNLDTALYNTIDIKYSIPTEEMDMHDYAKRLSLQIDTSKKFVIIGVSLGGMLATEMSTFLEPEKTIIISSAKSKNELPSRYTFQKMLPVYKLVSPAMAKKGAKIMQPIVEPDRKKDEEVFESMLEDKNPLFLNRTIAMIINWEREHKPADIIHIHGSEDNTIPIKNVDYDYKIEEGSHMMVLTKGEEISELVKKILMK